MHEADKHSHVITVVIMCAASSHITCLPPGPHSHAEQKVEYLVH